MATRKKKIIIEVDADEGSTNEAIESYTKRFCRENFQQEAKVTVEDIEDGKTESN